MLSKCGNYERPLRTDSQMCSISKCLHVHA